MLLLIQMQHYHSLHLLFAFGLLEPLLRRSIPISPPSKIHYLGYMRSLKLSLDPFGLHAKDNVSMVEMPGTDPGSSSFYFTAINNDNLFIEC